MIQPNPEIEVIVKSASQCAKELNHEYVTLEHLLRSMVIYQPFNELLENYGVDTLGLITDIDEYLVSQGYMVSTKPDLEPRKIGRAHV